MTPTFCAVCEYLLMSENHYCPLCGWPANSTPVSFGVEQVRKIIGSVQHWHFEQNVGYINLTHAVFNEYRQRIKALEDKVEQIMPTTR